MPKWLTALLGVLAVAIIAAVGVHFLSAPRHETSPLRIPPEIIKIDIVKPNATVVLEKAGGAWHLRQPVDHPADANVVNELLQVIGHLQLDDRLTQRSDSHGQYEVTEASGTVLRVYSPAPAQPVSLVFGKMAPDYNHVYTRILPSSDVYLASGLKPYDLDKSTTIWAEKKTEEPAKK